MDTNKQWKRVPFDIELAKKIQSGEVEGRIVTRKFGYECTIVEYCIYTGHTCQEKLLLVKFPAHDFEKEKFKVYHYDGRYMSKEYGEMWFDLVIELLEETPELYDITTIEGFHNAFSKHKFKIRDKVIIHPNNTHSEFVKGYCGHTGYIANIIGNKIYVLVIGAFQDCFSSDELELVNKPTKYEFKPFERVLVREHNSDDWRCDYFSHGQNDGVCTYYVCSGGEYLQCIPYEGNEHLVGTTVNPIPKDE